MRIVNRQRPAEWPPRGWYWLLHHQYLLEWTDDIDERWQWIIAKKSEDEIDIRLSEIAPVLGIIPIEISEGWAKCEEAWAKYTKALVKYEEVRVKYEEVRNKYMEAWDKCSEAWDKCSEAWAKYWEMKIKYQEEKLLVKYKPELEIMHKSECPNSRWDGETILPEAKP